MIVIAVMQSSGSTAVIFTVITIYVIKHAVTNLNQQL